jgi:hypothetical protein
MIYKGFGIIEDQLLGWSGLESGGKFMVSCSTQKEVKVIIDNIVKDREYDNKNR